ncbi:MAG: leucyl/phenylalanyl-tRNA--protein transferase [Desulfobacterales bacterium]|jgi:leucyl/phenylalanyl-tRNA--protein transferase|nr:leucyl/phenylalanyl-tRNA--protein transferase [Desulfobacterales bacterium]
MPVFVLSEHLGFPPPRLATPEGLLAVGGDLNPERLVLAYRMGIFPWYSEGEPILWWSPDPRLVLYPSEFHIPRSLSRTIRREGFDISMDQAFAEVITECGRLRLDRGEGTWIVPEMIEAYCGLHRSGLAHSVEVWAGGELAGGLYGVSLGAGFFGESMFSRRPDASKAALAALVGHIRGLGLHWIDCQVSTGHLQRMGAREIPRARYLDELHRAMQAPTHTGRWSWAPPPGFPALCNGSRPTPPAHRAGKKR